MNTVLKIILVVIGLLLVGYGLYHVIIPETEVNILDIVNIEAQNNSNSYYVAIGVGLALLVIGAFIGRNNG